jgi:hypothetical protein
VPSVLHEALVELFRRRPLLAAELLEHVLGEPLGADLEARVIESDVSDAVPLTHKADSVVVLYRQGRAHLALIVEVQLGRDARKKQSWPRYLTGVAATYRCKANVLVFTTSAKVERWARQPIHVGLGHNVITPIVIGPAELPDVGPELAHDRPELAVLSAMAHPSDAERFEVALGAVAQLDEDLATDYTLYLLAAASPAVRAALERDMPTDIHIDGIGSVRAYLHKWREMGRQEGEASALMAVLEARGFVLDDALRARISSCTDSEQLESWLMAAARAERLEDVFGE